MKTFLVTGINGFVGHHLARAIKARGYNLVGLGTENHPSKGLEFVLDSYIACDLTNRNQVKNLPLKDMGYVVNLAGLAQVGASFSNPDLYKNVNVDVLSIIGENVANKNPDIRLLAISSGAVYDANQSLPLSEQSKLTNSGSPYTQSKIMMEQAAKELCQKGVDCIVMRPFNHIGPNQKPGFLVPDLLQKLKNTKSGDSIKVGNLKTKRDYTDVRDVVEAYVSVSVADKLKHKIYNVCSDQGRSGEEILKKLLQTMNKDVRLVIDKSKLRPSDPDELYGSYERLKEDIGWQPQISFDKTIQDIVNP